MNFEFVEGDSTMNIEAQFNLIAEEYDCNRRKLDKECSMETEIQIPQAFLNAPVLNREEHDWHSGLQFPSPLSWSMMWYFLEDRMQAMQQ